MNSPLKLLHLASFTGNVGDNANHLGFRPWLEHMLDRPVSWHELEIREFYWKERAFDSEFVKFVNQFDLLIIGGGNYFELWVADSHTGTSIDIPLEIFSKIETPIFFNALGVDAGQGATELSISRFKSFLDVLLGSEQYLVTVRNDGANQTLAKYFSNLVADQVAVLPDGGFFAEFDRGEGYFGLDNTVVGINLACDMEEIRFGKLGGTDGYMEFCKEMSKSIDAILSDGDVAAVIFPHIYSDLRIITDVVYGLSDRLRRTKIAVAPYSVGPNGANRIFGGYAQCDLVLGMRFHANVCPIGMGKPTIGLNSYPQIKYLYEELEYPDGCIDVSRAGFVGPLTSRVKEVIQSPTLLTSEIDAIAAKVRRKRQLFEPILSEWLGKSDIPIG
jgi:hypothetical protein